MSRIFFILILFSSICVGDVRSTTGSIKFDTQMDGESEMVLNEVGLGIGTHPSANLHVSGNTRITSQVIVGGANGSSNLHVNGTIGYGFQEVASSTTLSGNSIIFADSSNDNITLRLPESSSVPSQKYTIKKTSHLNKVNIRDGGFIDNYSEVNLSTNSMGSLSVISSNGNWHILNISGNGDNISTDNLIAWWKLDETSSNGNIASDSSGHGLDGNLLNISASNIGVSGQINNAIDFDGVEGFVEVPDSDDFDITKSISLSLWFRSNVITGQHGLITKGEHNDAFSLITNNSKVRFSTEGLTRANIESSVISTDTWYHVVGVYNESTIAIYLNGSLDTSGACTGTITTRDHNIEIGREGWTTGRWEHDGIIDDVRIYDRALTSSEIQTLYSQGQ